MIQYPSGTQDLTLTIEPGERPNWWVDSSYAVHPNMQNHSGIIMTLGRAVYTVFHAKMLNTKSSMEVALVAIDDALGQVLWTCHFLAV